MQPVFARANDARTKIRDETAAIQDINRRFPMRALCDPQIEGIIQPFSPGGTYNIPPLELFENQRYTAKICKSFEGFDDFLAYEMNVDRERSLNEMQAYAAGVRRSYAKDEGFGLIKVEINGVTELKRIMVIEPFTTGARRVIGVDRGVVVTVSKEEIYNIAPQHASFTSALIRGRMNVKDLPGFNDRWAAHFRDMIRSGHSSFTIQALEGGNYYNLTTVKIYIEAEGLPSLDIEHFLAIATAGPAPAPEPASEHRQIADFKTTTYRNEQPFVTDENLRDALEKISAAQQTLLDDPKGKIDKFQVAIDASKLKEGSSAAVSTPDSSEDSFFQIFSQESSVHSIEIVDIIAERHQRSLENEVHDEASNDGDDDEISADQEDGAAFGDVGFWQQDMPPLIIEAEEIVEAAAGPVPIEEADGDLSEAEVIVEPEEGEIEEANGDLLEAQEIVEPDEEITEETNAAFSTIIASWATDSKTN